MSYQSFLASRGYKRVTVERTQKAAGDLVLHAGSIERIPDSNVLRMKRRAG